MKKIGRPSLYGEKTKIVSMNLPLSAIAFLDEISVAVGVSRSMVATEIIEEARNQYLNNLLAAKEHLEENLNVE